MKVPFENLSNKYNFMITNVIKVFIFIKNINFENSYYVSYCKYIFFQVKNVLFRVYNQFWPHQESAARVLAAELLIKSDPTIETVGTIVMSLSNQEFSEINTLVLSKLYSSMQRNNEIRYIYIILLSMVNIFLNIMCVI